MHSSRRTRQSPVSRRLEETLELPHGLLGHCTRMEWTDNQQVVVEGCCAVSEYDENRVQIAVAGGHIDFWGCGLRLNFLAPDVITLKGQIQSVEFTEIT